MTKQGLKAIEEIKKGDLVLSYNDNLGIYEYKDVVDVYVNETTELCHIKTANDEIVCTPNHSILTEKGWMLAKDIKSGDTIQATEGSVEVLSVEKEELQEKTKVYNFNVLGYHTYVIDDDLIVVHNDCHGNSLDSTKENKLYNLVDDQGNIHKIGETTKGYKRYIHNLQHEKLIEFVKKFNRKSLLNKSLW